MNIKKKIDRLAYCLIVPLLLFSCTQDEVTRTAPATGEAVSVHLDIAVADMQPGITIAPATRTTGNDKHNALSVGYRLPEAATRSDAARTDAEKALKSLWMLQFDGTATNSTLIKKTDITASVQDNAAEVTLLANNAKNRVYLVANADVSAFTESGTTLQNFEQGVVNFAPCTETELVAKGLPMIATADIDPRTDNPGTLMLQSMVTKLTLQCNVATGFDCDIQSIVLNQVTEKIPVTPQVAGDAANRAPGITDNDFVKSLDITPVQKDGVMTCYFPENLAGRKSTLTEMWERNMDNAPTEKAAYIKITGMTPAGKSCFYTYYLGDGTPQDFNIAGNRFYKLALTLQSADDTDLRVESYFDLNPGGNTANCYLVYQNSESYGFDATVMGNGVSTPANGINTADIIPSTLAPASAVVLWEQSDPTGVANAIGDVVKSVRMNSDKKYICFTTGAKPGNAVIAALDGGGNIIWSWHIWRLEANPGDVECYTPKNGGRTFTMMDLNLGALNNEVNNVNAYGLHYQWGRKDPFPGATGITTSDGGSATFNGVVTENGYSFAAVNGTVTAQEAIRNPMRFYCGSIRIWISVQQDNLWGNPYSQNVNTPNPDLGSKSIYDPCPVGYRVPPQDTWWQMTTSNSTWDTNGYQLGVGSGDAPAKYFYPATGIRQGENSNGQLGKVGSEGYYWSSSIFSYSNIDGDLMNFGNGYMNKYYFKGQANGMSVRCVKGE